MTSSLQALTCSRHQQLEADSVGGSAEEPRCTAVDDGAAASSDGQPVNVTITPTSTTKHASVALQADIDRAKLREREVCQTTDDERPIRQEAQTDTDDNHQVSNSLAVT